MNIRVAIADDHTIFLKSVSMLIKSFPGFEVVAEAAGGNQLLELVANLEAPPDIVLMDVEMPKGSGNWATEQLLKKYPNMRILALSMLFDDYSVLGMIRAGACGYLLKEITPEELESALHHVHRFGFYKSEIQPIASSTFGFSATDASSPYDISPREREFLKWACTDATYQQIAAYMFVSPRTIDGYREALFEKLRVKSRVALVLEAIRLKLIELPDR